MVGQVNAILWVGGRGLNSSSTSEKGPFSNQNAYDSLSMMISQSLDYSKRNMDSCKLLKLSRVYMSQAVTGPGKSNPTLPSEMQAPSSFQNDCWVCIYSIPWNEVPFQEERTREERLFLKRFNFLSQNQIHFLETSAALHWPELHHVVTLKCKGG